MSTPVPISVVIAAHDEEAVIARCLEAMLNGVAEGELEVVIVCNGCTDRTAEVARGYAEQGVRVVETPVASKTGALNLGDTVAVGFPRFYVDADVTLPLASIGRIASRLEDGALAASPVMTVDLRGSSAAVRAYYRIWMRLPYVREGMIGVGVYALSEEGRARFGSFPDVIADDGYVRMLFADGERVRVDGAPVRVRAPESLSDLLRTKTRSRLGRDELGQRFPELVGRERKTKAYGGAMRSIVVRPWLWPAAAVYTAVVLRTRRRARKQLESLETYVWERDHSSRRSDER
jgi:glycosyltransferase involved in cell wall biosynthesis